MHIPLDNLPVTHLLTHQVPIYTCVCWLALRFKDAAVYLDFCRDVYEARRGEARELGVLQLFFSSALLIFLPPFFT